MTRQWIRAINLEIGGVGQSVDFSKFRIKFDIKQRKRDTHSDGFVSIYNLSKQTVKKIVTNKIEFQSLTLSAGYVENVGQIYHGKVVRAQGVRENPVDTRIDFSCAGFEDAINWGVINKAFAAGSTHQDHVDEVMRVFEKFGVKKGTIKGLSDKKFERGVSLFGMARDVMNRIAFQNKASWFINNGYLNHIPLDDKGSGDAIVLNPQTGLIGMPQITSDSGIQVTALINPAFKLNGLLKIDPSSIQPLAFGGTLQSEAQHDLMVNTLNVYAGTYLIDSLAWRGDTHGSEWYALMYCHGVGGAAAPSQAANVKDRYARYQVPPES